MRNVFTSLLFDVASGIIGTVIISLMILAWRRVDPEAARRHVGRFGWPAATAAFVLVAAACAVLRGASGGMAVALSVAMVMAVGLVLFVRRGPARVRRLGDRFAGVGWPALACLSFLACLNLLLDRQEPTRRVVMAIDLSDDELIPFHDLIRSLEPKLGARIVLKSIESGQQRERLSGMVGRGRVSWDLVAFDNDLVGAMAGSGLVQELGDDWSPPSSTIPALRGLMAPCGGPAQFTPLRAGLQLGYFHEGRFRDELRRAPPADLAGLVEVARLLHRESGTPGVVLQAGAVRPAATTFCEIIGTDRAAWNERSLSDDFRALRALGPLLHPESTEAGFDLVRDLLDCEEVDLACNWSSAGRPWGEADVGRRAIGVYAGWQRWHVLGGDVLAIPRGAPNADLARRLVALLTEARTQRKMAGTLHWIPARLDAFDALPDDVRRAAYSAIERGVVRPPDPSWPAIEEALSDAMHGLIAGDEDVNVILAIFLDRTRRAEGLPCAMPLDTSPRPADPAATPGFDRVVRTDGRGSP